ncbi:MAG: hypothetical protein A3I29_03090 [Candidatus Magasanikbacteria bacterium RIFCSPLOWO2_02_FULL_44_11]|uniref:Diacylglycerol kinase n=2 Tax=Candidatus Magasanikiibacteriota TaxID=1752731 RepID=A0A1F6N9E2_9BACT|nr:MAG: hypothetical protein A3D53_01445 [Candidatus Magasanikbacteria bacterium RIFCSPHIGHO2_02_FULL_45_10]OGH80471.1 MAG: hypothetical protein A3I29_03090 [Candidatus Magasanikbacteria bacterium RIFCSPLOWO2_02_FULL_44_11]
MSSGQFIKSFIYAWRGLKFVFKAEQNFRVQSFAALLVFVAIFYFPLAPWETVLLILLVIMVLTIELLNTALERFTDLLKPRLSYHVETIKDIMAAAVLLTSLAAVIIGSIILGPHFIGLIKWCILIWKA